MKKICLLLLGLCLPSICMGQVSLEWLRATPQQRKKIEERAAQEAGQAVQNALLRQADELEQGSGARLGLSLPYAAQNRLWQAKERVLLPTPGPEGLPFEPERIALPALRAAKRWNLQTNTRAFLLGEAAYGYRLDFLRLNGDELYVKIFAVENKGPQGKPCAAEFFAKALGGRRYGLFVRVTLVEDPPPDTDGPVPQSIETQIGVLWR